MERYSEYKDSGVQWLGEIPKGWECVPFKSIFEIGKGLSITKADLVEDGVKVISYGQIHCKSNKFSYVVPELVRHVSTSYLEYSQCLANKEDFLIADTSEDVEGAGNFVRIDIQDTLFAGYHTILAKNKKSQNGPYLAYLMQSNLWKSQIWVQVHGVKLYSITKGILTQTKFLLPPLPEQHSIVSFLDSKCSKIDEWISKKQKEVELLGEAKQRIIADAVTRGLNPNVKMKKTGIAWLEEVPEHWRIERAKNLFNKEQRPIRPNDEIVTCFRDGEVTLRKNRRTTGFTEATDYSHYQHICRGDLVIHQMDAFAGSSGVSDSDGMGTPVLSVCTPKANDIDNYYYAHIVRLMGHNGFILSLYRGIRERSSDFRFDTFAKQYLPVPPLSEQHAIVSYITSKTTKIDSLMSSMNKEIEHLKEYKQRLISDVVTGQIKVCEDGI